MYEHSDRAGFVEEYETNDDLDERFRQEVAALRFFSIHFHDLEVTRRFLVAVAREIVSRGETAWIDTDYGRVIHASDLLKRVERNADWDWRRDSSED